MSTISNPFEKFQALKTISMSDEVKLKNAYEAVLAMDLVTKDDVLNFQNKRDVLEKHNVNEMGECYFLMTTDIASAEKRNRQEHYDQVITPLVKEYEEKLNQKFLASKAAQEMMGPFKLLRRNQENQMNLFSQDNLELEKQTAQITNEITEIQGKLTVNWRGEEKPIPALGPFLKSADRKVRKEAFESLKKAELKVHEEIDEKFDKLLTIRHQIAKNAGFPNYTSYRFKELQRFDWDETHCFEFHAAVKKHISPLVKKLMEKRKANLKLDSVQPYDLGVDINGREPLEIYKKGDTNSLIEGAGKIIKSVDDELYKYFNEIKKNQLFDLDSRENKAPGGYMVMYPVFEQASVFYNGVGLSGDLMVLLHELGHCFHYFLGKDVAPYSLQMWTSEVAEAGSMSMEFIGLEKMHEYLGKDECQRIKEDRLASTLRLFAMCARGDEFQHWIYANPGHTPQMRRDKWLELTAIYSPGMDVSSYSDELSKTEWQFPHILQMPYYFIDYAISELLALTIWDRYKKDPVDGITRYKNGCSVAASKTVPEIYEVFGTKLNFGEEVIGPIAKRLESELNLK
jgi:oligoendopeptidase F